MEKLWYMAARGGTHFEYQALGAFFGTEAAALAEANKRADACGYKKPIVTLERVV